MKSVPMIAAAVDSRSEMMALMRSACSDGNNAIILITHYQRLLNYIQPDFVHILFDGRIVKSEGKELALEVESRGYDWLIK